MMSPSEWLVVLTLACVFWCREAKAADSETPPSLNAACSEPWVPIKNDGLGVKLGALKVRLIKEEGALKQCGFSGTARVLFGTSGRPLAVNVVDDHLNRSEVGGCVCERLRAWRIPAWQGDSAEVVVNVNPCNGPQDSGKGIPCAKERDFRPSLQLVGLENRSSTEVFAVLQAAYSQLEACGDSALPSVVKARWRIEPSGKVVGIQVDSVISSTAKDCLIRELAKLQFSLALDATPVALPLSLKAAQPAGVR